jgi:predicted permease
MRHAWRLLSRTPVFTATAILSLAVGIGANTAIFTAANAIFFAPAAGVQAPGDLVDLGRTRAGQGFDTVSYPTYVDLRSRNTVFAGVYAYRLEPQPMSLGSEAGAERIYAEEVSANYFEVLGLAPAAGGFFRGDEEQPGTPLRKVVLSHGFWQSRFSSRADIAGTTVLLNGETFVVAGVGPRGYRGMTVLTPDVWVPLTSNARGMASDSLLRGRDNQWLVMTARLKPDTSIAQARAAVATFAADVSREHPASYREFGLAVAPASRAPGVGRQFVAPFLAVLMGVAGLVLLVTCTNLAGLLLARGAARSREVAVRLALGASRRSLIRLLMSEAAILAVAGSAAALLVAWWMTAALEAAIPTLPVPLALDLAIDWRVLAFTAGVALVTAVLTGLAPALQGSRANLVPDLKRESGAPRRQRLRHIFITAQLAFCLVLVVIAGLFVRALGAASHVEPGFAVADVEVASLDLALGGYTDDQSPVIAERIREQLAAVPGVEHAGFARMIPLDGGGLGLGALRRPGVTDPASFIRTDWNVVSPDYFSAIGLPIQRGRNFTTADRAGVPGVAIVNEQFAAAVWPGQEPLGQRLEYGDFRPGRESSIRTVEVVGIARDAKYRWVGEAPAPFIYVPYAQQPMREVHYFLRRAGDRAAAGSVAPAIRQALAAFDRNLPLVRVQPLSSYAEIGLLPQRLAASIAGSLGMVALLLAGIGIYGVTAYAVASRTREIGVRIALGADRARVMRLVVLHGARLAAIGGAIGVVLAFGATQLITSLLFGISPLDPLTYAATFAILAAITMAATVVPARRAAMVDPNVSLRAD